MLRGCSFTYANKDSRDFNLELYYVDNSSTRFMTGGGYNPVTDNLPSKPKTLLYGLDYSAEPLKFEIEILNPHDHISQDDFTEIKDWLFNQDGWKKLYLDDEDFYGLHLNCLLIPKDDIADVSGYRGLVCEVINDSPFWYGEEREICFTKADFDNMSSNGSEIGSDNKIHFTIDIETQCNAQIYPTLKFYINEEDYQSNSTFLMNIHNEKENYESDFKTSLTFGDRGKTFIVDCEYGTCEVEGTEVIPTLDTNYDFFYLERGQNNLSINAKTNNVYTPPTSLSIIYTPYVRVGGF